MASAATNSTARAEAEGSISPYAVSPRDSIEPTSRTEPIEPRAETNSAQAPENNTLAKPQPAFTKVQFRPSVGSTDGDSEFHLKARRNGEHVEFWQQRRYREYKYPILIILFYVIGLAFSIAHCAYYASLNGAIVGNPKRQERNLRVGTACAFVSQIAFSASVWQTYSQWIWRSAKKIALRMATLNDIFGADTSVMPFLNIDMLKSFKVGYVVALLGWALILPPFFSPGTLFVYDSTHEYTQPQQVPYLTIANGTEGQLYAYSPSDKGDRYNFKTEVTRIFTGPRTILTLLSTATAGSGQILSIKAPSNHSTTTVSFYGPAVRCLEPDLQVKSQISALLQQKMNTTNGNFKEVKSAYYGFVPSFESNGSITALADARYQAQFNASNEIWQVFERYSYASGDQCDHYTQYQVCKLWNATYDLTLSWENGFQTVTGSPKLMHEVLYPHDKPGDVTDMAQHAYSALMWVLSDQLVGSFGWYNDTSSASAAGFGMINSPIQHNVVLGTSDLSVFFDYNEEANACQIPFGNYSLQRQQDVDLARNRTLGELVEELMFNMTVSLMHNPLLTNNVTRDVTKREGVNRYGYNPFGLFIPYGLEILFTLITVITGVVTYYRHGMLPGKTPEDILAAADQQTVELAQSGDFARRHSVKAVHDGRRLTLQSSPIEVFAPKRNIVSTAWGEIKGSPSFKGNRS